MRRLAAHVHVNDEHGKVHVFGPGDQVPDWAAAKITNPKAWEPEPEPELAAAGRPARNASREVWAAFAGVRGIDVPDGATRDQIIAAVDEAEHE